MRPFLTYQIFVYREQNHLRVAIFFFFTKNKNKYSTHQFLFPKDFLFYWQPTKEKEQNTNFFEKLNFIGGLILSPTITLAFHISPKLQKNVVLFLKNLLDGRCTKSRRSVLWVIWVNDYGPDRSSNDCDTIQPVMVIFYLFIPVISASVDTTLIIFWG